MTKKLNIVICGHGAGAIAIASLMASTLEKNTNIILLELSPGKISKDVEVLWPDYRKTYITSCRIISDPKIAIPNADIIVFCHLINVYENIFEKILDHLTSKTKIILAMPGTCGFDWLSRCFLSKRNDINPVIAGVESLPFICRKNSNKIDIFAIKKQLYLATTSSDDSINSLLSKLLGCDLIGVENFLFLTLLNPNAKIHPVLVSDYIKKNQNENFYNLSNESQILIDLIEKETKAIQYKFTEVTGVKIGDIPSTSDWLKMCYPDLIKANKSIAECLQSHLIYKRLQNPEVSTNEIETVEKLRYIKEDLYHGLMSIKGLAELVEIKTPAIDKVISYFQKLLNIKLLKNQKIDISNIEQLSIPQKYDIDVLSKLTRLYTPHSKSLNLEVNEFKQNGVCYFGKLIPQDMFNQLNDQITARLSNNIDSESFLNLHLKEDFFAKFCSLPKFVDIASKLLDDTGVRIFSSIVGVKMPNGKMLVPWHQDAAYDWPLDPPDSASLWIALDNVTLLNGVLNFALGGHLKGKIPMAKTPELNEGEYFFSKQLKNSIPLSNLKGLKIIRSTMLRGECSFHHSMLPHSSGPNMTNSRRCGFIIRFCKKEAKLNIYKGMPREEYFRNFTLFKPILNPI